VSNSSKGPGFSKLILCLFIGAAGAWVAVIVASGVGWNPFGAEWNFSNSGEFGDSFGPLSALMASIAALSAIAAFRAQASEAIRVRGRDNEQDALSTSDRERQISRNFQIDERARRQVFESTFFRLVETFRNLVESLQVEDPYGKSYKGNSAFEVLLERYRQRIELEEQSPEDAWKDFSKEFKNDLNHYFRLLYHVVRYVSREDLEEEYFYIQILRAMLTDAELCLIGINCIYGEGREKFKVLIEKYALLHNLSEEEKGYWKLRDSFEPSAFDREPDIGRFEYLEPEDDIMSGA
jgi:hypothetical protein